MASAPHSTLFSAMSVRAHLGAPTSISVALKSAGSKVAVTSHIRGWIDSLKEFTKHYFAILRDGAGIDSRVQVVIPKSVYPGSDLTVESYVAIQGLFSPLPEGKYSIHPYELKATHLEMISHSSSDFSSVCPDTLGTEQRLTKRHLALRLDDLTLVTKLRSKFLSAIRGYFDQHGCTEIVPPSFVGNQCEGGATLFKVDHVGRPAYLTQSSQFYLEMALPAVGDAYCIAPSFRAEKSQTRRHLTEFLHAEAEWGGIFTMEQHVEKLRHMLAGILKLFLTSSSILLDELKVGLVARAQKYLEMLESGYLVMTHREAIEYCRTHDIYKDETPEGLKTHFDDRDDIPECQERKMIDQIGKIVFLTKFPHEFKSFYMARDPADPTYVLGCDVEVPGVGEIVGSGVRVSDADELKQRLIDQGLKEDEYSEYIDLRKYGHGRTSGMGLGVDRMLTWLLDLHSIREVVTFPRYPDCPFV